MIDAIKFWLTGQTADLLRDFLWGFGPFPALGFTLRALQRAFLAFLPRALRPAFQHHVQARVEQDLMEHFVGNTACGGKKTTPKTKQI